MADVESTDHAEVTVIGRLGARVTQRTLPSGDVVTVFTVVVDRPSRARHEGGPAVDAIPCQTFRSGVNRRLATLREGDRVRVEGTLRRRFWRTASGLGSALEVEAGSLRRMRPLDM
jgi:single-strand DNA-binding protein